MPLLLRLALVSAVMLAGCRFPADPERTLDRVEGGALRVGLLAPRDAFEATPEAERVARIAQALGGEVSFHEGHAHDLVADLQDGRIDLLAGGLPESTPFAAELALSKPWGEMRVGDEAVPAVFGLRQGENAFLLAINRGLSR